MIIDVWKTSRSYTNMLVNVMINSSIMIFLKQQWFPLLNNSPTKLQYHLTNMGLLKLHQKILLHQFSEVLDAKPKTAVRRFGAAKLKQKYTRTDHMLC